MNLAAHDSFLTDLEATKGHTLILGIGNVLMGDEGVGVHLAQRIAGYALPKGVDVLDGGTGGFHLMEYFESYPRVILIDATLDGRTPGTIRRLRPRFATDFPRAMSTHDIGLKDLVGGLTFLDRLPDLQLFAVSIAMVQPMQMELSDEVETIMPDLIAEVLTLAGTPLAAGVGAEK